MTNRTITVNENAVVTISIPTDHRAGLSQDAKVYRLAAKVADLLEETRIPCALSIDTYRGAIRVELADDRRGNAESFIPATKTLLRSIAI